MKKAAKTSFVTYWMIAFCITMTFTHVSAQINPYQYSISKTAEGKNGAVSSAHPLASIVGLEIIRKGGNAFDAAIATQLALAVVYPGAGNIGGGGFLVAHTQKGKTIAIDYREKAPGASSRNMYLDDKGNPQLELSQNGHLASGVPGTVAGLFTSHKYGKLSFEQLIQPAIELAEKGFVITAAEARSLNGSKSAFLKYNTVPPVFVKSTPWKEGDTLIQVELAATLKRIQSQGAKGFYEGETARLIVEEMKRGKGNISLEDLKNYQAIERPAVSFAYKGYTIIGMPMPSSGGLLMEQMMKMIENRNIAQLGFHTPASVQLMIEVERRAYADRAEFMGDQDFVRVPVKTLSSKKYLDKRMEDFMPGKATPSDVIKPGAINPESMTPTVVLKNKKPYLVVGTPGGTTIPTSVFQTLVNIIEFNQSPIDAVNHPKFHHQWLPDQVAIENDFPFSTQTALSNMGYTFQKRNQIGRTEVIKINWEGKKIKNIEAVADKRGDDHAAAY